MAVPSSAQSSLTSRERMLRTLRREAVDRFPVWLKMSNRTWQSSQPDPYRSMPGEELLRQCGCDLILGVGVGASVSRPHVTERIETVDGGKHYHIETPDGVLEGVDGIDPVTGSTHPLEYLVTTADDLRALRWYYRDTSYSVAPESVEKAKAHQRQIEEKDAISMCGVGPSPLMHLIQHLCGPIDCIFLMADEPELFDDVVELMHQDRLRELKARLACMPADTFWLTENTTTSLINPEMFSRICVPQLTEYGNMVLESDTIPVHHMCGLLNALLEDIDGLPAMANEAYTTPPIGNTTLVEGRTRMPSKSLIGGTNATLWLESSETIVEAVADDLASCPDRLGIFLTSAGVLPAQVTFEKAREVVHAFQQLPV